MVISMVYEVPTIRIQEYSIEEIGKRNLVLFTPFLILRYANKLKNVHQPTKKEIYVFYQEIIDILNQAYNSYQITELESGVLIEAIKKTENYILEDYPKLKEGVDRMLTETFELKSVKIAKEAAKEATRETTLNMLADMYQNNVDFAYIQQLAEKKGITDSELNKALDGTIIYLLKKWQRAFCHVSKYNRTL